MTDVPILLTGGRLPAAAFREAALARYAERHRPTFDSAEEAEAAPPRPAHAHYDPEAMATLARIARAIAALERPTDLQPGAIAILRVEADELVLSRTVERDLFPVFCQALGAEHPWLTQLIDLKHETGAATDLHPVAEERIRRAIQAGATVLAALPPDAPVPDMLAPLVLAKEITLPPLTCEDVAAMLRATNAPSASSLFSANGEAVPASGSECDPSPLAPSPEPLGDQPCEASASPSSRRAMSPSAHSASAPSGAEPAEDAATVPPGASPASVPPATALPAIPPFHLAHAWQAPDAPGVLARLNRAAAWVEAHAAAATAPARPSPRGPRLRDLHGLGDAEAVLTRVVADVAAWSRDDLEWDAVGASILLHGPPGVGKTSVANALATEIGGDVIDLSFTTVQSAGHLGLMLRRLQDGVAEAMETAPCVVLIDEADDLADRAEAGSSHARSYMRSVVNGYLTQLTALADMPGVVVVLATNYPNRIDPAIVRAGRCDHRVALHRPDRAALERILSDSLGAGFSGEDDSRASNDLVNTSAWDAALDALSGGSGADAAALARETIARARDRVRAAGTPATGIRVGAEDLAAAVDAMARGPGYTADELWRIAIHEAGHILVGHLLNRPRPIRAWIGMRGAGIRVPIEAVMTLPDTEADLATLYGGREAERLRLGAVSSGSGDGPQSDLAKAAVLAAKVVSEWHLGDTGEPPVWRSAARLDRPRRAEGIALLRAAERTARDLVNAYQGDLDRIAAVLTDERDLSAERIGDLLDTIPVHQAHTAPKDTVH